MALTAQQLQALRTVIDADPALVAEPLNSDGHERIAKALNLLKSPDFFVWRTDVSRADIYHNTSAEGTTWNWTTYKNQGVAEQNAWVQMFMGDVADFSKANLRAGVAAIFTGSAQANAQRDHALAVAKRKATRAEAALATGTGTSLAPAVLGWEGFVSFQDVEEARR